MPLRLIKMVANARSVPEVDVVIRILVGMVGLFVLIPVVRSAMDPTGLAVTDYVGLVVFTGVGLWLLWAAIRGSSEG